MFSMLFFCILFSIVKYNKSSRIFMTYEQSVLFQRWHRYKVRNLQLYLRLHFGDNEFGILRLLYICRKLNISVKAYYVIKCIGGILK